MPDNWTLIGFGAAVFLAGLPSVINVYFQGRSNAKQEKRRNEFSLEQERLRDGFVVEREHREEQREREKILWQLEFDKFQRLEVFLNELVFSVHNTSESMPDVHRSLWLMIEQFNLGFPNYPDVAHHLYELEALYLHAKQNQGQDYLILKERCKDIVMTCRTALMVGLPVTVIEGQQVTSKPRTYG